MKRSVHGRLDRNMLLSTHSGGTVCSFVRVKGMVASPSMLWGTLDSSLINHRTTTETYTVPFIACVRTMCWHPPMWLTVAWKSWEQGNNVHPQQGKSYTLTSAARKHKHTVCLIGHACVHTHTHTNIQKSLDCIVPGSLCRNTHTAMQDSKNGQWYSTVLCSRNCVYCILKTPWTTPYKYTP